MLLLFINKFAQKENLYFQFSFLCKMSTSTEDIFIPEDVVEEAICIKIVLIYYQRNSRCCINENTECFLSGGAVERLTVEILLSYFAEKSKKCKVSMLW